MLGLIEEFRSLFAARACVVDALPVSQVMPEAELIERLPACDGWIIGDDPATRSVLAAGRGGRLRAALKRGIGIDNVDLAAVRDLGIGCTNTPGMFDDEVADYAMAYVTALARDLCRVDRAVRAGGWAKPAGTSLRGKVVGLVGYGHIGRATAARLAASGLEQVIYDPAAPADTTGLARWPDGLERDFLVFSCALTAANRHTLDADTLARCRRGVRIVNVARGSLIDGQALAAALTAGHIHGAALDIFERDPCRIGIRCAVSNRSSTAPTTPPSLSRRCAAPACAPSTNCRGCSPAMAERALGVLISGAAGGIGAALVGAFAGAGYRVVASDCRQPSSLPLDEEFIAADLAALASDDATLRDSLEINLVGALALAAHQPAGRLVEPAEVATLALFLASPSAGSISGAAVAADGGIGVRLHDLA